MPRKVIRTVPWLLVSTMGLQMACWLRITQDNPSLELTSALCESHSLTSKDCPGGAGPGCVGLNTATSSHHEAKSFVIRATASFPGLSALTHNLFNVKMIRESPNNCLFRKSERERQISSAKTTAPQKTTFPVYNFLMLAF